MSKTSTLYGIKNCDTMKKAFKWLDAQSIAYDFHDYKKSGIDEDVLKQALTQHSWENVINRRGTTWRKLPKETQESMDVAQAIAIAVENPSIIKRPLLKQGNDIFLGFKDSEYEEIFG